MKTIASHLALWSIVLVAVTGMIGCRYVPLTKEKVRLTVIPERTEVAIGDTLLIRYRLQNVGDGRVLVCRLPSGDGYEFWGVKSDIPTVTYLDHEWCIGDEIAV